MEQSAEQLPLRFRLLQASKDFSFGMERGSLTGESGAQKPTDGKSDDPWSRWFPMALFVSNPDALHRVYGSTHEAAWPDPAEWT